MNKLLGLTLLGGAAYVAYEMYFAPHATVASTQVAGGTTIPPTGTTYISTVPASTTPVVNNIPPASTNTLAALRASLVAAAGTDNGYNFDQWNYYYQQLRGMQEPGTEVQQIFNNVGYTDRTQTMTVDQFINDIQSVGLSGLAGLGMGMYGTMMYNRQGVTHPVFGYHN